MRLRLSAFFKSLVRPFGEDLPRLSSDKSGNFGLTFALVALPMLLGLGVSVDYVRAYNVKAKMQGDLDAALIAAVKKVDSLDESQIKTQVANWFAAQSDTQATYKLLVDTMVVSKTNRTINAVATGVVPTVFLGIANIKSVNVSVTTSVAGPATQYLNVYLVFDKSASMMLAATSDGQTLMKKYASGGCVFACHVSEGTSKYNGVTYSTNYDVAKAMGVQLRSDVSIVAAQEILDLVAASDPTQSRIKVGLYSIGTKATEVLSPSSSMSTVKTALLKDTNNLTSATSEDTTDFKTSLEASTSAKGLADIVGSAGDGKTVNAPLKLVLLLTDGVQSQRPWVTNNPSKTWDCVSKVSGACVKYNNSYFPDQTYTSPMNPTWCSGIKSAGVTMGVLYTEYLAIPLDWGYNGTVGDTMKNSSFATTWKGVLDAGVSSSISRRDYIPYALESCASDEMFLSAASPTEIETGLSKIFQQYLGSVRLTQ